LIAAFSGEAAPTASARTGAVGTGNDASRPQKELARLFASVESTVRFFARTNACADFAFAQRNVESCAHTGAEGTRNNANRAQREAARTYSRALKAVFALYACRRVRFSHFAHITRATSRAEAWIRILLKDNGLAS